MIPEMQQIPERQQRSRPFPRPEARSTPWMRWLAYAAAAVSLVLSFVITLQLTKPTKPLSPSAALLAKATVLDGPSLMMAVRSAGLKGSSRVKGGIDEMTRLNKDRMSLKGWAIETSNGGAPLVVIAYVDGKSELIAETKGRRPNLASVIGPSEAAAAVNASFEGTLSCAPGHNVIIIAIADDNEYGYFGSAACHI